LPEEALPVTAVSRSLDRVEVTFDEPGLVADAGLLVVATLIARLGLETLVNQSVVLVGRVGGSRPGRKVLSLVASILAGGSHIDHAERLRAGATHKVLPFRVMAPSTLGTFLRSFTFGHVRQLDAVIAEALRRAWALGAGPGAAPLTIDVDSTICNVYGKLKQGAAYGYTKALGYHPLLATRAGTGEVLHARLRKGSSMRGAKRFVEELIARARRAGASGTITVRADSAFFSWALVDTLTRASVHWSLTMPIFPYVRAAIEEIDEGEWQTITYPDGGVAQVAETTIVAATSRRWEAVRLVVRRTRPPTAPNRPCGQTGATTPSSPISTAPSSRSTSSTATTPPSSSPSATSKRGPGSSTARRGASSPTRRGSAVPCSPTTSPAGRRASARCTPPGSSPSPAPCAPA